MTIPEACQLILQASSMGSGGEIFVLDMGTPIKILDLAKDLIRLSGYEPDKDIKIEFTGLRLGEKLYEELILEDEAILPTTHEKIMVLKGISCDCIELNKKIDQMFELVSSQDNKAIVETLKRIVVDYRPSIDTITRCSSLAEL